MAGNRSLGTLTVDLVAKTGGFEQGLSKAERELDKRAKRMNDIAKKIGVGIGTAITAGISGAVAAAGALSLITKQAIDNADAMRDLSIRVGESTETLSAYGYAASQTGTDVDTLSKGMKVLAKNVADGLNPTNEYAKVFAALGIELTDNEGRLRKLGDLIPEIADRFQQLEDGTTKAALAQSLFGRAGLDLTEFLNQGSEGITEFTERARELGIVVGQDTADAADEFNDKLGDARALVAGLGLALAKELLPDLNRLIDGFTGSAEAGDKLAETAKEIADLLRGAGVVVEFVSGYFKAFGDVIEGATLGFYGFAEAAKGVINLDWDQISRGMKLAREGSDLAYYGEEEASRRNPGAFDYGSKKPAPVIFAGEGPEPAGLFKPPQADADLARRVGLALSNPAVEKAGKARKQQLSDEEKEAKRLLETYQRLTATYDERIALFGNEGEAAKVRYDIENGELAKLTDAQKADLLSRAERLDQMNEELELQKKLADEDKRRLENYTHVMQSIKDQTQLVGLSWEQQEIWNNLKWAGVDADSDWGRQIIASTKALQEQRDAMADQIEIMDGARSGAREFFDSMKEGEGILNSLKDAFGKFADALYDWATNSLIDQFFGKQGTSGQGTAGGGWLSALFGSSGSSQGSIFDLFSGSWGFAGGGTMAPYSVARVNELGMEMASVGGNDYLLTGSRPVEITPHRALGRGGASVTQNFYNPVMSNAKTQFQIAQEQAVKAQRAMARS